MKISEAAFAGSSTRVSGKPKIRLPEIAFIGRSNVGKSSLINMLCGNRRLALTSSTPGKTKLVNHFIINNEWYLVDLPGYGYAKMANGERDKLQEVIRDYLNHSEELLRLFILVDSRHGMQKADENFLREIYDSDIPFAIIFTKGDKSGPEVLRRKVEAYRVSLAETFGKVPETFVSSSETGSGKDDILDFIAECLENSNRPGVF